MSLFVLEAEPGYLAGARGGQEEPRGPQRGHEERQDTPPYCCRK